MAHHRRSHEMDDFVTDEHGSPDSQSTWAPGHSSPIATPLTPSVSSLQGSSLNPDNRRRRGSRAVVPTSSVDSTLDLSPATAPVTGARAQLDMYAIDPSSSTRETVIGSQSRSARPLREAAANAYSPIRKHARIDLGYVSDIAEADDSDDSDELDADSQPYAPFQTQTQSDLDDDGWLNITDCEDVGSLNGNVTITSDRFVELGHAIKEDGYLPLVHDALTAEYESGSKFGKFLFSEAKDFWEAMSMTTLCSMPEEAVKELICGNLKQAYDSDETLREQLDKFQERGRQHPSIYARSLTTATGELMTTSDARRLAKWLQRYVSVLPEITGHPHCAEAFQRIDSQFRGQWKRVNPGADRVFLASTKQPRLQSRVDNVILFSRQLIARCEECDMKDIPLKPLTYIGYAARADQRKRQHEACGKSSNWLATLVQAVCNVIWGQGRFQMHFMVICMLSSEEQGMIAEMLLTRIAGAYYNVGGGFCIDVAGKSMESLHFQSLTQNQRIDKWNDLNEWVSANTPIMANMSECARRTQDRQARLTAARITKTEAGKKQLASRLATHRERVASWSDAQTRYPDDPGLQSDEWQSLFAKAVCDLKEMEELVASVHAE